MQQGGGASRSTDPASGTSSATDVSLREFLEQRVNYERQISNLREEVHQTALRLQAAEYERRLDGLNHEAQRLQASVAANVSNDTWEAFEGTYKEDNDRLAERFKTIDRFQNKLLGAIGLSLVLLPAATAFIVYLLTRHAVPVK